MGCEMDACVDACLEVAKRVGSSSVMAQYYDDSKTTWPGALHIADTTARIAPNHE